MVKKVFSQSVIFILLLWMIAWFGSTSASAQCEYPPPSSCMTCHAQEHPVNENGEWHIIHASKDICVNCHGGNASAAEIDLAHEDMTAHPLDDIYTDCHSCHPDYDERARRFAPVLGVTPGSCATPTPIPVANHPDQPPANGITLPATASPMQFLLVIGVMFSVMVLFLVGVNWLERHEIL